MILGQHIAKMIVERTMSIVDNNINIMNCKGVIMASGDTSRIGEVHEGALQALQHCSAIEVTQALCETLKGAQPGINLIFRVDEQVLGVVGVTGEPDDIRVFANLVKMTAEMMAEQALVHEQSQWERRHHDEFISAWLNASVDQEALNQWASRLAIDITIPRVAIIIEFDLANAPPDSGIIRKLIDLLEKLMPGNLTAILSTYEIVVLKPVKFLNGNLQSELELNNIKRLIKQLNESGVKGFKTVLGFYHQDITISYSSAQRLLDIGKQQHPEQVLYVFSDYRMPLLLSPLEQSWQGKQLTHAFNTLRITDKNGTLIKTLIALFASHGKIKDCASLLYIHRNTLRYRLERIESITGLSPYHFESLFELYMGYVLCE